VGEEHRFRFYLVITRLFPPWQALPPPQPLQVKLGANRSTNYNMLSLSCAFLKPARAPLQPPIGCGHLFTTCEYGRFSGNRLRLVGHDGVCN
jgi:hypothetical protein